MSQRVCFYPNSSQQVCVLRTPLDLNRDGILTQEEELVAQVSLSELARGAVSAGARALGYGQPEARPTPSQPINQGFVMVPSQRPRSNTAAETDRILREALQISSQVQPTVQYYQLLSEQLPQAGQNFLQQTVNAARAAGLNRPLITQGVAASVPVNNGTSVNPPSSSPTRRVVQSPRLRQGLNASRRVATQRVQIRQAGRQMQTALLRPEQQNQVNVNGLEFQVVSDEADQQPIITQFGVGDVRRRVGNLIAGEQLLSYEQQQMLLSQLQQMRITSAQDAAAAYIEGYNRCTSDRATVPLQQPMVRVVGRDGVQYRQL